MVFTDLKDNKEHFIYSEGKKVFPDYIVSLPLRSSDVLPFNSNLTCSFGVIDFPKNVLKPLCIEHYDKIDNKFLNEFSYKYIFPSYVLVFNKYISDIDLINKLYSKSL